MTDDTDTAEREKTERAGSLPLIDTFAALEAELAAKEKRIERLERELSAASSDAEGSRAGAAEPATGTDPDEDSEPRSHEDWVPETDPLSDTGTPSAADDQPGVTPEPEATSERTGSETTASADDSGLKPVRTASSRPPESARNEAGTDGTSPFREEYGLTMESTADLTGGSLGSSTDESFPTTTAGVRSTEETSGSAGADTAGATGVDAEEIDAEEIDAEEGDPGDLPPDPTADRGERLSRLVRRAELLNDEEVIEAFVQGIESLDDVTREMLAHYREVGDAAPVDAHVAAGGSGERQYAYARNRTLRQAGVIEHDSGGHYRYALPDLVAEALDRNADSETLADAVDAIESETGITE